MKGSARNIKSEGNIHDSLSGEAGFHLVSTVRGSHLSVITVTVSVIGIGINRIAEHE